MKCSYKNCSQAGTRRCAECFHYFCDAHAEKCEFCQAYVCFDCREQHQSSPLHEGDVPPA